MNWEDILHIELKSRIFKLKPENIYICRKDSKTKALDKRKISPICDEKHSFIEMFVVLNGDIYIESDNSSLLVEKGSICIIPKNTRHVITIKNTSKKHRIIWSSFDNRTARIHLSEYPKGKCVSIKGFDIPNINDFLMESTILSIEKNNFSAARSFLISLYYLLSLYNPNEIMEGNNWDKDITKKLKNYIQDNLDKKFSLTYLSDIVALSPQHLCVIFKKTTGQNLFNYISLRKIEYAKIQLENTSKSINEISMNLGYSDQFSFSKAFKKYTGKSPSLYRKVFQK